jgi:hypothetical protein
MKLAWEGRPGPRKYDTIEARETTGRQITIGRQWAKAERSGLKYSSTKGRYQSTNEIPARHEWDLKAFKSFDENPTIKAWYFLRLAVPYPRSWIPPGGLKTSAFTVADFEVEFNDGRKKIIVVRPDGVDMKYQKAFQSLDQYCVMNGYEFEYWTKEYFSSVSG